MSNSNSDPSQSIDNMATVTTESPAPKTAEGPAPALALALAEPFAKQEAKEEEEEPQNALTKKFTEQEWKALKEFRNKISSVIAEADSDGSNPRRTAVVLWGVTINSNGVNDAKASVILMKFLRARNLNSTSAAEMLTATLRWRDHFKVDELVNEQFPADVFGKLGYVYGKDKSGRPVIYNLYGANQDLKSVFGDVQRFLRWRIKMMEQSIEKLDFEDVDQMVQVHDYQGVSITSRDPSVKNAAAEATSIFQSHYPEFLSRKFFINVPSVLTWIFWLFKPLLSAQTIAKMSVVGSGPQTIANALREVIDIKEIPKRYGGEAEGF